MNEGGREGEREGGREGEGSREREGGREGKRERGEREREKQAVYIHFVLVRLKYIVPSSTSK